MKLAMNYSPQAADLACQGAIQVDVWKLPDWPNLIETVVASHPGYVHLGLQAGRLEGVDWEQAAALMAQTDTPYANLHLEVWADGQGDEDAGCIAERLIRDIGQAVEHFGAERVIVENVPYQDPKRTVARAVIEPQVIRQVIEATGCGLLLDLSHARITAQQLGWDEKKYIARLPVERLRELHVTGLAFHEGYLIDHLPMTDDDWAFLDWALGRIRAGEWARPWALAFEYGGMSPQFDWRTDRAVMVEQVPRLLRLVRECEALKQDR